MTQPTSPAKTARLRRARGATLVEVSLVVAVLLLAAASVAPNVVAVQRSRQQRQRESALALLPLKARAEARRSGEAVRLRVDDRAVVLERVTDDNVGEEVERVELGEDDGVNVARLSGEELGTAEWEWNAYPDGSADEGALEVSIGGRARGLVLPANGPSRWLTGGLSEDDAEGASDVWEAGEIEVRAQTQ